MIEIIKGLKNYITSSEDTKQKAKKRLSVCESCSVFNPQTISCSKNKYELKDGKKIYGCGCYLPLKVLSDSKCPLDKWDN